MRRIAVLVLALVLAAAGCGNDDSANVPEGFVLETTDDPGPDAFTAPVDTEDARICDIDKFIAELESRPDAFREWARVLGIPQSEVENFIRGLEPTILESDLAVTNHGLSGGQAYARASVLEAGTAVLVEPDAFGEAFAATAAAVPPPENGDGDEAPPEDGDGDVVVPEDGDEIVPEDGDEIVPEDGDEIVPEDGDEIVPEDGDEVTTTTSEDGDGYVDGQVVTRCKCGNPLLPPPEFPPEDGDETTTTEGETSTTEEGDEVVPEDGDEMVPEDGDEMVPEDGDEMVPEDGDEVVPEDGDEVVPEDRNGMIEAD